MQCTIRTSPVQASCVYGKSMLSSSSVQHLRESLIRHQLRYDHSAELRSHAAPDTWRESSCFRSCFLWAAPVNCIGKSVQAIHVRALLCASTVCLCGALHTSSCITTEVDVSSAMGKVFDSSGFSESKSAQAIVWWELISCVWNIRDPLACAGSLRQFPARFVF